MTVAIAHDQFTTYGGAERVAVELARLFDAPIYAGWVDESIVPADVEVNQVFDSTVAALAYRTHYITQDLYQMIAWQHVEPLYDYETVLINKPNAAWFVPRDTQTVLWYLHSTPRGMYDQFHRRGQGIIKPCLDAAMRAAYLPNTKMGDLFVCNSELVQRRAEAYWGLRDEDTTVVYPPVPCSDMSPDDAPTEDYYLTLGRLHHAKRTREIVEAANETGARLIVAGDGPNRETIERLAGQTVDVLGYVDEERKRELLSGARAFIMAAENEDFGMAPVEAMAAGTPVIGIDEGFTRYQIRDGENGIRFERSALPDAIDRFESDGVAWDEWDISRWATERFGRQDFRDGLRAALVDARERSRISAGNQTDSVEVIADGG